MVMDLRRVGNRFDFLADGRQCPGDEVGGSVLAQAKHHRSSDVVSGFAVVALEVSPGSSGDDVAGKGGDREGRESRE